MSYLDHSKHPGNSTLFTGDIWSFHFQYTMDIFNSRIYMVELYEKSQEKAGQTHYDCVMLGNTGWWSSFVGYW